MNELPRCPVCQEEIEPEKIIRATKKILEMVLEKHPDTGVILGDAQCQTCFGAFHIVMTRNTSVEIDKKISFDLNLIDSKTCQMLRSKLKDIIYVNDKRIDVSRN